MYDPMERLIPKKIVFKKYVDSIIEESPEYEEQAKLQIVRCFVCNMTLHGARAWVGNGKLFCTSCKDEANRE